jgi:flagellar biosynthesis protein FliP
VLTGLAVLLTIFVMSPALKTIDAEAYQPYLAGTLSFNYAAEQAAQPLKSFMLRQTRAEDLDLFIGDDKTIDPTIIDSKRAESVPLAALAPAFLTSELKTAFQIGFMVVLPFLVIDLVVAAVLTALGMIMLPPQLVSLPLKLLLFVTVDGWHLLVGSLLGSF